ncbi:MAG: TolC family protein [Ferruginibacter sp.]|nr:TolC family protein [Ferruginibacter sp.]
MKSCIIIFFLSLNTMISTAQKRQLNFFLNQAIENSPLLKDYKNQVKINEFDSLLLLATQSPQVSFSSNDSYAPVIKGFGYDDAITNGANVNALIGVNKTLLNGRNNKVQFANLQLLSDAIRNNAIISEQDIKKTIIGQYIITYGDMLQVNFSSAIQDKLRKEEIVLKKLTEKNVYRQVDYLTFYVTLQQNEFKLKQQVNQYKNDYATLNYLAGIADTTQLVLEWPDVTMPVLPEINSSAFFKKYEIDSLTLVNRKTLIDITYRPKLSVFADAGYNSSLAYKPYKNFGTSIGLSLVIPLYDGKQINLQYGKIALSENTRAANKQFYTNQYYRQVAQLKQQLQATSSLIDDINQQLKYIEALISVNEKLLQAGEVRVYDYILALNNFLNAKNLINENTISRLQIINQINYWNR